MRKSTLISASVATLSALYVAQNLAVENQPPMVTAVQPTEVDSSPAQASPPISEPAPGPISVPDQSSPETSTPPSAHDTEAQSATSTPARSSPEPAAPAENSTGSPEPAAPVEQPPVEKTVNSEPVKYQYGVIQLGVTAVDGTLTNVQVLQGDTAYGRDATYAALISASISAQGTNFGNYSGATFTTEAFRTALENALGKL